MKKVIYKKTGEVNKDTKSFPAILFRSRERNKNVLIGNSPVEVSDKEYDILKNGKHGKDIVLVTSRTNLTKPMEVDISGPKVVKEKVEKEVNVKTGKITKIDKSKEKKIFNFKKKKGKR